MPKTSTDVVLERLAAGYDLVHCRHDLRHAALWLARMLRRADVKALPDHDLYRRAAFRAGKVQA